MAEDRFGETLEEQARAVVPEPVHRYVRQGARDGVTTSEATDAWDRLRFLPQVLRDVTDVDTSTTLLGTHVQTPVAVAPTTLQRALHPEGELAMARAVAATGSLMVLSSNAGTTFEEIGATGAPWWLQMYVTAERPLSEPLVRRAVDAGARALVLTADTPVVGTKYDEGPTVWEDLGADKLRVNFPPDHGERPGEEKARDLGPQDVEWLAQVSGLPVVVKGVLQPGDARRCVQAGAAAVWVSNHGGRQLDRAAATADCLAAVVDAAGPDAEVYVDGGVRHPAHVLAALALGARGVFLGRPPLWALAVGGQQGVTELLGGLTSGLEDYLALAGCSSAMLVPRRVVARP